MRCLYFGKTLENQLEKVVPCISSFCKGHIAHSVCLSIQTVHLDVNNKQLFSFDAVQVKATTRERENRLRGCQLCFRPSTAFGFVWKFRLTVEGASQSWRNCPEGSPTGPFSRDEEILLAPAEETACAEHQEQYQAHKCTQSELDTQITAGSE